MKEIRTLILVLVIVISILFTTSVATFASSINYPVNIEQLVSD